MLYIQQYKNTPSLLGIIFPKHTVDILNRSNNKSIVGYVDGNELFVLVGSRDCGLRYVFTPLKYVLARTLTSLKFYPVKFAREKQLTTIEAAIDSGKMLKLFDNVDELLNLYVAL